MLEMRHLRRDQWVFVRSFSEKANKMRQIESLYVVEFGDIAGFGYRNGGVVILETNRVFGGDSGYFYLGDYSVFGDRFAACVKITKHNPSWENVFGDDAPQFEIRVLGSIEGDIIVAGMERLDRPGLRLPLRLVRKAPLP
jgi:hypothetical protein